MKSILRRLGTAVAATLAEFIADELRDAIAGARYDVEQTRDALVDVYERSIDFDKRIDEVIERAYRRGKEGK